MQTTAFHAPTSLQRRRRSRFFLVTDLAVRLSDVELPTLVVVGAYGTPNFRAIGTLWRHNSGTPGSMTLPDSAGVPNWEGRTCSTPALTGTLTDLP